MRGKDTELSKGVGSGCYVAEIPIYTKGVFMV